MSPRTGTGPPPRRVLWVEGSDDNAVVRSICGAHAVPEKFSVEPRQGVERLLAGLAVEVRNPVLDCFGVVVDANGDAHARWTAIRSSLARVGYRDVPASPDPAGTIVAAVDRLPRFGVWIMPDNVSPGALEDFAASLVPSGDELWVRAGEALDSIPEELRRFSAARRSKAHIHTWLAWQEDPGSPMGQAIGKRDLNAYAPAAQRFVTWLRRLMVEDVAAPPPTAPTT